MTARLLNPRLLAILALVLGLAAGPAWFWIRASHLLAAVLEQRVRVAIQHQDQAKSWNFWTVAIDNLTNELQEEKDRLRQRSDQLDQRAAMLDSEQRELAQTRADLAATQARIDARVITINASEEKNLKELAQAYTALDPSAAVAILSQLDDATAVKILSLMKPNTVGAIFQQMAQSGSGPDGQARRAAVLSDQMRLLQSAAPPAN
jgi:flagellar motility protein MotE (MotC chaperone)